MNAETKIKTAENAAAEVAHKNVHVALAAAQMEMGPVAKGSVNPHFKSKYADLADVMRVALPALNSHGIAVFAEMEAIDGERFMTTVLYHGETDTSIRCPIPLLVAKGDMQGMKSATTYAKRIGIESLTGIAPDDDDGNAAREGVDRYRKEREEQSAQEATKAKQAAMDVLAQADTLDALQVAWKSIGKAIQADPDVIALKDEMKDHLSAPALDDEVPY